MLKKVLKVIVLVAFLFSIIQNSSFAQDTSPAAKRLKLKRLFVPGINTLDRMSEWLKIDDSSSMAFIEDNSESTNTRSLYSLPISAKGKFGTRVKLAQVVDGWFDRPSALWIPEHNRGLVFMAYAKNEGPLKIDVIPFDKDGKKLAAPTTLLTINPPANSWVQFAELKAVRGSNRIGVFAAASFWQRTATTSHYNGCTVRFLKTYLTGKLTAAPINIPLSSNGKLQSAVMEDATFSAGNFLAPIILVQYETYSGTPSVKYGRPVESTLSIFSAPESTSAASDIDKKQITVFPKDYFSFSYILPQSEGKLILFYSSVKLIPEAQAKLDRFQTTYFIQRIDSSGKKIKRAKKVKMPGWQHTISYDPTKHLLGTSDDITPGIMAGDGTFFMAQTLCLRRHWVEHSGSGYDYEQLFRVLNIDPKSGKVKVEAESADTKSFFFLHPLMINFGKNLELVNQGYPYMTGDDSTALFFSRYRSKVPLN